MKDNLHRILKNSGERFPKKHGEWYRIHVYDNNYLVLDTWNGYVYHYPDGAEPTSTDNMYKCVYTFLDRKGNPHNYRKVKDHMRDFWFAHIGHLEPRV